MDRSTDTPHDRSVRGRRTASDRIGDGLRALVGPGPESEARVESNGDAGLRALVGPEDPARGPLSSPSVGPKPKGDLDLRALVGPEEAARRSRTPSTPDLTALVGSKPQPSTTATADLSELVDAPVPRSDDQGWMAPELALAGRRPRSARGGRGGSVGVLSIVIAVAAVAMLAGTTTFALIQRATANPAVEAMDSLREREAELRNEIKGLQTSSDLLTAVMEEAQASSQAAATVLPGLRGRVEDVPLDAADSARTTLDSAITSVPTITVPDYVRGTVDEQSLVSVGHALDEVRGARDALPPLVAQVRVARSGVASALDDFRARLRELGASIEATGERTVQSQSAAGDDYRQAVTDAAAGILSAQQAGGDGLAEMAVFAAAVDALKAENARVLEQQPVPTPYRSPSGGSVSPTTPVDPGGADATDPATSAPTDPGTGGSESPTPAPSATAQPGDAPTP